MAECVAGSGMQASGMGPGVQGVLLLSLGSEKQLAAVAQLSPVCPLSPHHLTSPEKCASV